MNIASAAPPLEADFFDEKGLLKQYIPQNQQQYQHTGSMFILKKIQDPSNAILLSEDGVEVQHSVSESRSYSNPYSRFPIPRISAHGSSKPISKGFLQHFRYVRSERNQQFFEKSHQEYRFTLEIRLKQQFTRRNERKQRSHRIYSSYTIFQRF